MVHRLTPRNRLLLFVVAALVVGGLFAGLLAQDGPEAVVPELPCAPLAAYAADIGLIRERLRLGGGTRGELEAANLAFSACIEAHGLSSGAP